MRKSFLKCSSFAAILTAIFTRPVLAAAPATQESVSNAFACDLYHAIVAEHPDENVFFSPFSLASVLAMTAEGARGETAAEIGRALHARPRAGDADRPYDFSDLHTGTEALTNRLSKSSGDDPPVFIAANALWVEKTFAIEQPFLATLRKYYSTGGCFPADFQGNSIEAVRQIDQWVSQKTNGQIKELIEPGQIIQTTPLAVASAVYFLGHWTEIFETGDIQRRDFSTIDGHKIQIPLMFKLAGDAEYGAFNKDGSSFDTPTTAPTTQNTRQAYPAEGGFQILQMHYFGDCAMIIVLPNDRREGLANFEKTVSAEKLRNWTSHLTSRQTEVYLPKFKLASKIDAVKALQTVGICRAFNPPQSSDGAQFGGISDSSEPLKRLQIDDVLQKSLVDVNEMGTEASAATDIDIETLGMHMKVGFAPVFLADHPFLFLIRDNATGSILFMGRFVKPNA